MNMQSRAVLLQAGEGLLQMLHVLGDERVIRIKPKSHMLCHMIYDLAASDCVVNPWMGCTWRDEDFIGKMMRMVKSVHPRAVMTRPIEFYAAKLRLILS